MWGRRGGDDPGVTGELLAIYVAPGALGTGIGRKLIEAGRRQLVLLGHRRAELWVLDTNLRARRFYARDGWQVAGEKKDTIAGTDITEVRYVRDL